MASPPNVSPPFSRTAAREDGQWQEFGPEDGDWDGAESEGSGLWRTTLHPHPISSFVTVTVVSIDLEHLALAWVVGAGDAGASRLARHMSPGLVADADASQVVAVFNGGFLARHGRWGQLSHGQALVPVKEEGCGVAVFDRGDARLGLFQAFAKDPHLVSYRQTPPCLVSAGKLHETLKAGIDRVWGGKGRALVTRRRSALGIGHDGRYLYYLLGSEASALDLGRALMALGAETGLQLDINWNWTRFFLVGRDARGRPHVERALVEKMAHDRGEYFTRPSQRDFFYLRRRHNGS